MDFAPILGVNVGVRPREPESTLLNCILDAFPTADRLLNALDIEVERVLLRRVVEICKDPMRRMTTVASVASELFERGGYDYDYAKRRGVEVVVSRAWKTLEDANLIEAPDIDNGKNGFRVASNKGRAVNNDLDFEAAKVRGSFTRGMFHPSLPDAAWNALRTGDYDTAVFEAFKAVESAVRKKGGYTNADFGAPMMKKAFHGGYRSVARRDRDAGASRRARRCGRSRRGRSKASACG
jgi:hypothetical protein